ncbi:MAG: hypothetical protein AB7P08_17615 [Burkholderiales bacterium]
MTVFPFRVGRAFLGAIGHPITVPKSHLPYGALQAEGLTQKNLTIICPRGERFEGQLYHGEAGYGEYYQIQFRGNDRTLPSYLKLDDRLFVGLLKVGASSYAVLEYRE